MVGAEVRTVITSDVALATGWRLLVLFGVLVVGFPLRRRHHWPIGAAVLCGLATNAFFLAGSLRWAGVVGVPYVALIGWIFIAKMRDDPHVLRLYIATKEAEWSKQRHDLYGEIATLKARLYRESKED